jgi:hypothetical protein
MAQIAGHAEKRHRARFRSWWYDNTGFGDIGRDEGAVRNDQVEAAAEDVR